MLLYNYELGAVTVSNILFVLLNWYLRSLLIIHIYMAYVTQEKMVATDAMA